MMLERVAYFRLGLDDEPATFGFDVLEDLEQMFDREDGLIIDNNGRSWSVRARITQRAKLFFMTACDCKEPVKIVAVRG